MTPQTTTLSVRLAPETRERIGRIAAATRRSQGDILREMVDRSLPQLEFENRILDRSREYRAGLRRPILSAEADKILGPLENPIDPAILNEIS